jgi:predicted porin
MKKTLVAGILATLVGAANATDPNVTVYGKMRIFQESYKAGTAGSMTQQTNDSSRLGFKGSEELGGGLKAFFTLETGVGADAPAATTLGDRTSIVGLSTSAGSIGLGRDKHSVVRVLDNFDAMGNVYGSSATTIHASQGSRVQNATFLSATPVKGLTINYQYSSSETSGVDSTQAGGIDLSLGKNLSASLARYDNGTTSTSDIVGGKFNLDATGTTIFAMYSKDEVVGVKTEGKSIGINQKLGTNLAALASYGEKSGVKAMNAGLTYNFSKRTMLHARYVNENADVNSGDVKRYGVGIEHNF